MSEEVFEISELKILKSAAGYYIGRTYKDEGMDFPYSRESGYFKSEADVKAFLGPNGLKKITSTD